MKPLFFTLQLLLLCHCTVNAQSINITSFQHSIRWLDEAYFPAFVTRENVADALLNAATSGLINHFGSTLTSKPPKLEYKNITVFGKSSMKDPAPSPNKNDLQVSIFSFITRATTGYEVLWSMKVLASQDGKTVYTHEIKHELKSYKGAVPWFTEDEFIDLFTLLLDELFENREPLGNLITLGTRPENKDSILLANCENWKVEKNKTIFGFAKPTFGPFRTVTAGKTDSNTIRKKSKVGNESSMEISNGKVWFDQSKMVDINVTKFCTLELTNGGPDSAYAFFSIFTNSRKHKQTVLGSILSGNKNEWENNEDRNYTSYYNRNVKGAIATGNDSLKWAFSINHYINGEMEDGYLANEQDSLNLFTTSLKGLKKEIVVTDQKGTYQAALVTGFSTTEILMRKDVSPTYQNAIATLFAILISIKNLPD